MAELPIPGPGRDSLYDPSMNDQVRKLALLGLNDEEMAAFFGVHPSTYYRWQEAHPAFREAVNEGKVSADANVADSFYKRATGEHVQIEKIVKDKTTGEHKVIKITTYIPGESGAALNWLKNRRRQSWADKQDVHVYNHENALDELK
jgi:transposase